MWGGGACVAHRTCCAVSAGRGRLRRPSYLLCCLSRTRAFASPIVLLCCLSRTRALASPIVLLCCLSRTRALASPIVPVVLSQQDKGACVAHRACCAVSAGRGRRKRPHPPPPNPRPYGTVPNPK